MTAQSGAARPLFADVTLSMISWKAPVTVAHTLKSYQQAGILELFGDRQIHFNEISASDREVGERYGFDISGSAENLGIFGAVDAVAQRVSTPFVLALENDCPLVTDKAGFMAMMSSALADMRAFDIPVFSMRSRREPGDQFARRERYERKFRTVWPIGTGHEQRRAMTGRLQRAYEDLRRSALRGCALYVEEDPTLRHPGVISKTANGNWLTSAPYLNWSNNSVLVATDFLRDVVLNRVRHFPAQTTINGHQDIEAALKVGGWWHRQPFLIGQSEPGPFTHKRLDR